MKTLRLVFAWIALAMLVDHPDESSAATLTTLYSFVGGADGIQPLGTLVQGSDSNFYGTTYGGGSGAGTVFTIDSLGTLTTLYRFNGTADGAQPRGALIQASDGNFYGTTYSGGSASNAGTVFAISPTGTLTTLHRFSGGDGAQPYGGLVQGSDSNFYGTTYGGGLGSGTVFRISTVGTFTSLYAFRGSIDGVNPAAGLVLGNNSNFFGTTFGGGASATGAVFRITAAGSLTPLYNFTGGADGANPAAGLVQGSDGSFYGTTSAGGSSGVGTVFKITSGGALTILHSFIGLDGSNPEAGLIQGSSSNYYGTTSAGGTNNAGTIFTLVQPCTYSLSPTHATLPAISNNNGTFSINASATNCPWIATSTVDWITITSTNSGAGDGMISYSVAANPSASARVGTITVDGKIFTVTQQSQVFGQFLAGTYDGLIIADTPAQTDSGLITLVLGKTGSFQASLTIGGVRSAFKGKFDASGNATNTVPRKNLNSLQVILQLLDVTNQTDQITGTVSDGVFTSQLLADLAVFSKVNPCPFAGRYTFVLEPADDTDPNVPQGYGYGTLSVTTLGGGRMQGVLGDGTKLTATFPVSGYGTWPLYTSLYKKQGSSIGLVTIATNNTLAATVNWFKPAGSKGPDYPDGFTTTVALSGGIYISPADGGPSIAGSGQLTLGGGNLESNLVKNLMIDAQGNVAVSPAGSDQLKLKINPTTGQFSGSFLNPVVGKTSKFGGLLLQPDNSGAGFFQGTNQTGFVIIQPAP